MRDQTELPKYLCGNCVQLLTQFKNFKETCIQSDKHLRDAISETIIGDEDLLVEFSASPLQSEETRQPETKAVNSRIKTTDKGSRKSLMAIETVMITNIKEESPTEFVDPDEKLETPSVEDEKPSEITETISDEGVEITVKEECSSDDDEEWDEEWNQPLKKKVEQPRTSKKKRVHREFRCTVPNCRSRFEIETKLELHLKTHEGTDVIFEVSFIRKVFQTTVFIFSARFVTSVENP
jgi:hypothetical protein